MRVVCNVSLDDAIDLKITLLTACENAFVSYFDGGKIVRQTLAAERESGGYRTFVLPRLPALSAGIVYEED